MNDAINGCLGAVRKKPDIRHVAMNLLARREHSSGELRQKLKQRNYLQSEIDRVMATLQAENLQSDERYTESFIRQRVHANFGPIKIGYELQHKGISKEMYEPHLEAFDCEWKKRMIQLRVRKFGAHIPEDAVAKMKQARFLQGRGFSLELVKRLLN